MRTRSSLSRTLFVLGSLGMCGLFHLTFVDFLSTRWEYYGFVYANKEASAAFVAYAFAIVPSLWIPLSSLRPSIPIVWFLYGIVLIPSMFCLALVSPSLDRTLPLMVSMLVGFGIMTAAYAVPIRTRRRQWLPTAPQRPFLATIWIISGLLLLTTAIIYRDSLVFPTIDAIYDVRLQARAVQQVSPFVRYFPQWLTRCLLPFLLVAALYRKRYLLTLPILAGYVLLFMATAHKVYFIVPLVVAALFLLIRRFPKHTGAAFILALGAVTALTLFSGSDRLRDLLLMRTMGWSGLASVIYDDFIRSHDVTYWSHIKGFSAFWTNPYDETIPFVLGYEYFRNSDLTMNAHFWAMDGIMAAGNAGVVVISVVCGGVLRVIDLAATRVAPAIALPWMGAYATSLGDAGLFSALLTGGLAFALLMLAMMPIAFAGAATGVPGDADRDRGAATDAPVTAR